MRFETEKIDLKMIVDAKIENYDNFIEQIQEANEMGISISAYDIQQIYNKYCYEIQISNKKKQAKKVEQKFKVLSKKVCFLSFR